MNNNRPKTVKYPQAFESEKSYGNDGDLHWDTFIYKDGVSCFRGNILPMDIDMFVHHRPTKDAPIHRFLLVESKRIDETGKRVEIQEAQYEALRATTKKLSGTLVCVWPKSNPEYWHILNWDRLVATLMAERGGKSQDGYSFLATYTHPKRCTPGEVWDFLSDWSHAKWT